jgi:hypothetical protein
MSGTTAGTTSGTVLQKTYNQRQIIDRAARKAGYSPQELSSEWIALAQDQLFSQLSEYVNFGFPLWTRQQLPLPIAIGSPNVPMPYGSVDAFHIYWRTFNPYRGPAADSNGNNQNVLFAGQPNPDVTITGPNPGVIVAFGASQQIDTIGVLPGFTTGYELDGDGNPVLDGLFNPILATPSSYAAALELLTSQDGITYQNAYTPPSTTFQAGVWAYFDLEPSISAPYMQLILPGSGAWVLNQLNFVLPNSQQIDIGKENIDDYYDLPNRFFQAGQPNTAFVDRKRDSPVIKIWPTPNQQAFYGGTIVALLRRYIQDPGSMTNSLEIPARWIEGVTSRLGVRMMDELPDPSSQAQAQASYFGLMAKQQRRQNLETTAAKAEASMWAEERPGGPLRLTPNLTAYTK